MLGLNKEKRLVDLLIGATNNYKWKGTAYNTYNAAGTGAAPEAIGSTRRAKSWSIGPTWTPPSNSLPTSSIRTRASRCSIQATTVLVMPAYRHAAHRVFNAAEINYAASGSATTTVAANPLGNYRVVESRLAYRRLIASGQEAAAAKKWWFIGDFRRAFAYMENWPITVTQSPNNSEADFNQDIVVRFKASERGAAAVHQPALRRQEHRRRHVTRRLRGPSHVSPWDGPHPALAADEGTHYSRTGRRVGRSLGGEFKAPLLVARDATAD